MLIVRSCVRCIPLMTSGVGLFYSHKNIEQRHVRCFYSCCIFCPIFPCQHLSQFVSCISLSLSLSSSCPLLISPSSVFLSRIPFTSYCSLLASYIAFNLSTLTSEFLHLTSASTSPWPLTLTLTLTLTLSLTLTLFPRPLVTCATSYLVYLQREISHMTEIEGPVCGEPFMWNFLGCGTLYTHLTFFPFATNISLRSHLKIVQPCLSCF